MVALHLRGMYRSTVVPEAFCRGKGKKGRRRSGERSEEGHPATGKGLQELSVNAIDAAVVKKTRTN